MKTVNYVNISNDDDNVKFIKKTPLHPRERLKRLSKNYLIRNQTDKKHSSNVTSKKANTKKLKTKVKTLNILKM